MDGPGNPDLFHDGAGAGEFSAAVVPSRLLRVGYGVLTFASLYLLLSLLDGLHSRWDAKDLLLISVVVVTVAWSVRIQLNARGRGGRRNRVEGHVVLGAGVAIIWTPLIVKWLTGRDLVSGWILLVGLVLCAGGVVMRLDGTRPYRQELKERFGTSLLYRKSWLGIPLLVVAAVWVAAAFVDGAVVLTNRGADLFSDSVALGTLILGVVGTVVMIAAPRRKVVYADHEGHVVESLPVGAVAGDASS